jgi:GTP-binding protein
VAARATRRRGGEPEELPTDGLPLVAIVGRPNVGKSTLFNRIVGGRPAVVEDRPRTTRDRLYEVGEWNGRRFIVVDTGGLELRPGDPIEAEVQTQARLAIEEADVILFVVDAAAGETPADAEAAELLRRAHAPVLLAVNKADNPRLEIEGAEFHRFGWTYAYAVSAIHGRGTGDLLDAIVEALPPESEAERERKRKEAEAAEFWPAEPLDRAKSGDVEEAWDAATAAQEALLARPIPIAIVGRPNVGKSSLLNALLGEQRAIVSEIPGTTRDAIDTRYEWNGQQMRLIDTAGIRRRGKVASGEPAERYSVLRALRAVSRAEIAILVLDAVDGLTAQDAHVAGYVVQEGKGLILALNKWDLVEKDESTFDDYVRAIRREAPFLDFAPVIAISAKSGLRVPRLLEAALEIHAQRRRRIPTGELNRILGEATFRQSPPMVRGRRPKFFYSTQASVGPPTFVLFTSDAGNVHFSYARYLENALRDAFGFGGTPIRLVFRNRSRARLERRGRNASRGRSARTTGSARSPARAAARGRLRR